MSGAVDESQKIAELREQADTLLAYAQKNKVPLSEDAFHKELITAYAKAGTDAVEGVLNKTRAAIELIIGNGKRKAGLRDLIEQAHEFLALAKQGGMTLSPDEFDSRLIAAYAEGGINAAREVLIALHSEITGDGGPEETMATLIRQKAGMLAWAEEQDIHVNLKRFDEEFKAAQAAGDVKAADECLKGLLSEIIRQGVRRDEPSGPHAHKTVRLRPQDRKPRKGDAPSALQRVRQTKMDQGGGTELS